MTRRFIPATKFKFFTSTWQFLLHITRELAVGNPSAIEGQTANIWTSRTGIWARCSTRLLEFEKYLMSLLAETKRRVIPATQFKFFTSTWQFSLHITRELAVGNPSAIEGQTANIRDFANGILSALLNEFAAIRKVCWSLLSETKGTSYQPRNLNSSQVLDNFYGI